MASLLSRPGMRAGVPVVVVAEVELPCAVAGPVAAGGVAHDVVRVVVAVRPVEGVRRRSLQRAEVVPELVQQRAAPAEPAVGARRGVRPVDDRRGAQVVAVAGRPAHVAVQLALPAVRRRRVEPGDVLLARRLAGREDPGQVVLHQRELRRAAELCGAVAALHGGDVEAHRRAERDLVEADGAAGRRLQERLGGAGVRLEHRQQGGPRLDVRRVEVDEVHRRQPGQPVGLVAGHHRQRRRARPRGGELVVDRLGDDRRPRPPAAVELQAVRSVAVRVRVALLGRRVGQPCGWRRTAGRRQPSDADGGGEEQGDDPCAAHGHTVTGCHRCRQRWSAGQRSRPWA